MVTSITGIIAFTAFATMALPMTIPPTTTACTATATVTTTTSTLRTTITGKYGNWVIALIVVLGTLGLACLGLLGRRLERRWRHKCSLSPQITPQDWIEMVRVSGDPRKQEKPPPPPPAPLPPGAKRKKFYVGIPAHHTKKKKKKTGESQKHVSLDSEFLDEEQQVRLLQEQQQEQIQVQQEKLQELQQQQVQPQQPEQPQQQNPEQRQEIAANPKASDTKTSKPSRESDPKTFKMRVWGKKGRATS